MSKAVLHAALFALLVAGAPLVSAAPAFADATAHSLAKDQQRFVAIVRKLEQAPMERNLWDDRAWAVQWLTDAPDVTVSVCLTPLGDLTDDRYAYEVEIIVQYTLGMGAFIIENPIMAKDRDAHQLAGVESALIAYRSIRQTQTDTQSSALEKLLALQRSGALPKFVQKAYRQCLEEDGK